MTLHSDTLAGGRGFDGCQEGERGFYEVRRGDVKTSPRSQSDTEGIDRRPHRSPGCFLCFHCAIIGREQTTTSGGGGKAIDSSVSNAHRSLGERD